jgi:hypothetical protein
MTNFLFDNIDLEKDLREHLSKLADSNNISIDEKSVYFDLIEWLNNRKDIIAFNRKLLVEKIQESFPSYHIVFDSCPDDDMTYMISVYGVSSDTKQNELIREFLNEIFDRLFPNGERCMLVHLVTEPNTKKYYPEYWGILCNRLVDVKS